MGREGIVYDAMCVNRQREGHTHDAKDFRDAVVEQLASGMG